MLSLRTSLLALVLTTFSVTAEAGEPRMTVELKDGASVRGELVERVPGKQLTLLLATGEVRTIEWSTIARIDEPGAARPPQPAQPAVEATPDQGVSVHMSSDDPRSTLQRRAGTSTVVVSTSRGTAVGEGEHWEDLCAAPCDRQVAVNQTLRVAGDGVTPSGHFVLQRDAKLDVKAGSVGRRVGGFWLTGIGVAFGVMGGLFLALDSRTTTFDSQGRAQKSEPAISPSVSYVLLGSGIVALVGGIALIATSGTSVHDETGKVISGAARPGVFSF